MWSLLRRLGCSLRATWHGMAGRVWYRVGAWARARAAFERVLALRGDDFAAYVHLGRLAFSIGDYAGWRREFEHARRTDPERFARLRQPFDLFEPRAAGTPFDEAGDRATWRTLRPLAPGSIRRGPTRSIELPTTPADASTAADDTHVDQPIESRTDTGAAPHSDCDDCQSSEERRRFRQRGPISRNEIDASDLEDTCRRLTAS